LLVCQGESAEIDVRKLRGFSEALEVEDHPHEKTHAFQASNLADVAWYLFPGSP